VRKAVNVDTPSRVLPEVMAGPRMAPDVKVKGGSGEEEEEKKKKPDWYG